MEFKRLVRNVSYAIVGAAAAAAGWLISISVLERDSKDHYERQQKKRARVCNYFLYVIP